MARLHVSTLVDATREQLNRDRCGVFHLLATGVLGELFLLKPLKSFQGARATALQTGAQGGTVIVVVADAAAARNVNMRNHARSNIISNFAGALTSTSTR